MQTAGSVTEILGRPMRLCVGQTLWGWKRGHIYIVQDAGRRIAVKQNEYKMAPKKCLQQTGSWRRNRFLFFPMGKEAQKMMVLSLKWWSNTKFYLQYKCVSYAWMEPRAEYGTHMQTTLVQRHAGFTDSGASFSLQAHQAACSKFFSLFFLVELFMNRSLVELLKTV